MKRTPHIALLCGSNRQNSFNRRLLGWMAERLPADVDHTIVSPGDVTLPMYCSDLEANPAAIAANKHLHARLVEADALIVASPEHNGMLSAYLKNILDWQSRIAAMSPGSRAALTKKWVLLASASPGQLGGIQGLQQAKYAFSYLGCYVFPTLVTVANANTRFETEPPALGEPLESFMQSVIQQFCDEVKHFIDR